jgi:hypothetical protein
VTLFSQPSRQPAPAIQSATAKASVTLTILNEANSLIKTSVALDIELVEQPAILVEPYLNSSLRNLSVLCDSAVNITANTLTPETQSTLS